MKTMKGLLVAVGLAISIGACSGGSPSANLTSPTPPPTPTYTLSGVIATATPAGLVPIEGVSVQADLYKPAVTDANGFYTISGLPALSSTVTAWKPSYVNDTRAVKINGDTRLDIQLVRLPTFTLSGVVSEVTETGPTPVEGVQIDDWSCDPVFPGNRPRNPNDGCLAGLSQSTTTDNKGRFSISGVYATQNFICASKEGYRVSVPHSECGGESLSVSVDGNTRFDIQLVRR